MISLKRSIFISGLAILPILSYAANVERVSPEFQPVIAEDFLATVKKNTNWKKAFITGEHEQVVFMNISPLTNPANEIGMEVHPFDQVIFIVSGKGQAVLGEKTSKVKSGDLLFIPKGTKHNVINLEKSKELKIASFYSDNDIPKDAEYRTKADTPSMD